MTAKYSRRHALIFFALCCASAADAQVSTLTSFPVGSVPESITLIPSNFGTVGGDYFVPDAGSGTLYAISPSSGALTSFAMTGGSYTGGTFVPSGYGSLSGDFLLSGDVAGLKVVSSAGAVSAAFSGITDSNGGSAVAPSSFGSVGGQILIGTDTHIDGSSTAGGQILALNSNGTHSVFATITPADGSSTTYGVNAFGLTFAPTGFGSVGGNLLVSDTETGNIYAINSAGKSSLFATVNIPGGSAATGGVGGLRQIAFAPAGYGSYAGDLFASVSGSTNGGGSLGSVDVINSSGTLVAVLEQGTVGTPYDPRGLLFTSSNQLLVADTDPSILVATSAAFTPVPLPATFWLMFSSIGGLGALARKRKTA